LIHGLATGSQQLFPGCYPSGGARKDIDGVKGQHREVFIEPMLSFNTTSCQDNWQSKKKDGQQKQLHDLIRMDSPESVLEEVIVIVRMMFPDFVVAPLKDAFHRTRMLYRGEYPGYRACNTGYHDIHHTTAAFLATARLVHGAVLKGKMLSERSVAVVLIAALLHDAGYIQKTGDKDGSGAKYTAHHVERSIAFLERHGSSWGLSNEDIVAVRTMILCTEISTDISSLSFADGQTEFLGRVLEAGDLIGQRADRAYPEKLLLLYQEFKEGNVGDFQDELDLLRDAIKFSDFVQKHLEKSLRESSKFMSAHFWQRWNISKDLYKKATAKNMEYLEQLLKTPHIDPREHLRRKLIAKGVIKNFQDR
jgi:hypothetical protein